ncbi:MULTISPECIES: hypothetical protein [unclassified Aeromicrobium]|uniref:hypothetical protein n=1 Tax=unclassified Aeromicrobium TaxID=2633570 RepID=UPI00396AF262
MRRATYSTAEQTALSFVLVFFGSSLVMPLSEDGASWSWISAALSAVSSVVGLGLVALGIWMGVRLWHAPRGASTTGGLVAIGMFALLCILLPLGSISSGVWLWDAAMLAALGLYFVAILVLEIWAGSRRRQ